MEKFKDEMHDKGNGHFMNLDELTGILDAHVDEARKLVEAELVPYVYKYTRLCNSPRPESRFRREDVRFLPLK